MLTNKLLRNTLNEDDFKEMISESIKNRERFILEKHGMEIRADPRIIKVFQIHQCCQVIKLILSNNSCKGLIHLFLRKPNDDKNPKKLKEKLAKREGEIIEAIEEIHNLKDGVLKLSIQLKEKVE